MGAREVPAVGRPLKSGRPSATSTITYEISRGVTESLIEDGKRGDEVGAVRRFGYRDDWIRPTPSLSLCGSAVTKAIHSASCSFFGVES